MTRIIALLLVCIYAFCSSDKAERAENQLEGFDKLVEQAMEDCNVPGLAIGIVVDGHVVYSKGFGYRDLERKRRVSTETLFAIGSCTKAFTSFAMASLVEGGVIEWDQPVVDILPGFRLWDQYATQNLTFRDLMTHRTGLPRHPYLTYNSSMTKQELFKRIRYLEPAWDIRQRFNYGDLMYTLTGMAMEQATGNSWQDLIREKILKPLDMNETNFTVEAMLEASECAVPYLERNGVLKPMPYRSFNLIEPAAAINSNIDDLMHWTKMLLAGGAYDDRSLISPSALQEMFAAQVIVSGYSENKDALLNAYGLGWCIHSYRGHYLVSHDGGLDGFTSVISLFPQDGVGVVVLANKNLTNLPRYLSLEAVDRVLELPARNWVEVAKEHLENKTRTSTENQEQEDLNRKKGTMPSHSLEEYVGEYEHPGYGKMQVEIKEGNLLATYNGISSLLEHWHYDVFAIKQDLQDLLVSREGMKFSFHNNLDGNIEELHVPFESNTSDIVFKKKVQGQFNDLDYFRQFTGMYEIYGISVEIAIRNRGLVSIIPGQPLYELIPLSENEFVVKSNSNYLVRFIKDDEGQVKEVLLVLPYGAYSADKVK